MRAEIEDLPNDDFYSKLPLQRAVQLIKRYRDIYFEKDDSFATTSIVLTTLMANFYGGENSIYATLERTVLKIKDSYINILNSKQKFKVLNPLNNDEDFTDKWTDKHYEKFYAFINDFYTKWEAIQISFEKSGEEYIRLFGEGIYQQSLREQALQMTKFSSNVNTKSSALILSGNAYTNKEGNTNSNSGYKNGYHHNYGE